MSKKFESKIEKIFYLRYRGIRDRCNNPNRKDYQRYGGRGIRCEWNHYQEFKRDMFQYFNDHINEYGLKDTTLDRVNNNGNYSKNNCKWATSKEQGSNRITNIYIEFNGERKCIAEWARLTGVHRQSLRYRLHNGWSIKDMLTIPMDYTNKNGIKTLSTPRKTIKRKP